MASEFFTRREDCPLCGSDEKQTLYSSSFESPELRRYIDESHNELPEGFFEGVDYTVLKCKRCGFIWQPNVLNEGGIKVIYEAYKKSDEMAKERSKSRVRQIYSKQLEDLLRALGKPPNQLRVLDYGMGWGHWALTAKELGCKSYGFEVSKKCRDFAAEKGIEVLERNEIGGEGPFNIINLEQVLEHVPDPKELLQFLSGNLAEGGIMVIGVPNGEGVEKLLKKPGYKVGKDAVWPLQHINCFRGSNLRDLVASANLSPTRMPPIRTLKNLVRSCLRHLPPYRNLSFRVYVTQSP